PKLAQIVLSKVINELDSKLPGYLLPEKETGAFKWLESGGKEQLPFEMRRELTAEEAKEALPASFLILDARKTVVKYDLTNRIAYSLQGDHPTPAAVLSSLCSSGTLGREVSEVNEALLIDSVLGSYRAISEQVFTDLQHNILKEFWKSDMGRKRSLTMLANRILIGLGAVAVAGTTVAAGACMIQAPFAMPAFTWLAIAGLCCAKVVEWAQLLKKARSDLAKGVRAYAEELQEATRKEPGMGNTSSLRTQAQVIADHYKAVSGGRNNALFGELPAIMWGELMDERVSLDPLAIPVSNPT
ncbi:MAG: hypothetical protein ACK5Y6_03280, partial [Pseudomonadota bacterium]